MYCTDRCRSFGARLRRKLAKLPPCFTELCQLLHTHAPDEASGYHLVQQQRIGLVRYPSFRRRWWTVEGTLSYRRSFTLYPFEVPLLPMSGRFLILFVCNTRTLAPIDALRDGIDLDSLRGFSITQGDLVG